MQRNSESGLWSRLCFGYLTLICIDFKAFFVVLVSIVEIAIHQISKHLEVCQKYFAMLLDRCLEMR